MDIPRLKLRAGVVAAVLPTTASQDADALEVEFVGGPQRAPIRNVRAYELTLLGQRLTEQLTEEGILAGMHPADLQELRKIVACFTRTQITMESDFLQAAYDIGGATVGVGVGAAAHVERGRGDSVAPTGCRAFAAEHGCLFAATSSKLGEGVIPAFQLLARACPPVPGVRS